MWGGTRDTLGYGSAVPSVRRGCTFRDALGVEVCETGQSLSEDRVQFFIFYTSVGPIQAVLRRAVIRHLVGALETELLGRGGAGLTQFLGDCLILPTPQEVVINYDLPASSHVRLGIIRIGQCTYFYWQLRQH